MDTGGQLSRETVSHPKARADMKGRSAAKNEQIAQLVAALCLETY